MNELIFVFHLLLIVGFGLGTLRLGSHALMIWIVLQAILANLFVLKQITLFGFNATCSDVFAIGSILGLNLLQEYFGKERAQKTVSICFYFMVFFAVMSQVHLLYSPSIFDATQSSYKAILTAAPRLLFASLFTFFLVQKIDVRLFNLLKLKYQKASLSLRSFFSLIVTQLIDTVLFSFLGLFGLVESIFQIIAISFVIKLLILLCLTPITLFSKRFVTRENA